MRTRIVVGFPAHKVESGRAAVAAAHKRLVRAATRAGQAAPLAPIITQARAYALSRCTACLCEHDAWTGGTCLACRKGHVVTRHVVDLEVAYDAPVLAGWEFLAVVEPMAVGGNLIRQVPAATVAEGELGRWREGAIVCDHCGTARRRIETYVVRADGTDAAIAAGTYKQVGKQCLAAFLGGKSAAAVLESFNVEKILRDASDGEGGGWGGGPGIFQIPEFLAWTVSVSRACGFISKKQAMIDGKQSTSQFVDFLLTYQSDHQVAAHQAKLREEYKPTDADIERAGIVHTWAVNLMDEAAHYQRPATDYERNLHLVASQPFLDPKHAGILASAVAAYSRGIGESLGAARVAAALGPSAHLGTVGEKKHAFGVVTVERVAVVDTQYGALHIHAFRDDAGNAIVWATGEGKAVVGDRIELVGTIKGHTEYKGEAQTEVNRCKLVVQPSRPSQASIDKHNAAQLALGQYPHGEGA